MQPTRLVLCGVLLLCLGACSSTPTAPTPANIAGNWTGTFASSNLPTVSFAMNLTQAGANVNGTWLIPGASGTVAGTTTSNTFSGSFTFNGVTTSGGICTATASFSGDAGGATLRWTSPLFSGNCGGLPAGVVIAVQRN